MILMEKKIVGIFYENELQKANQKEFRLEKVIKRKGDKVYVESRILESLAGCCTMFLFAEFCKIGALERNAYWFNVKLIFIVILGQSFKLKLRA